jgi:hypothetical protein
MRQPVSEARQFQRKLGLLTRSDTPQSLSGHSDLVIASIAELEQALFAA